MPPANRIAENPLNGTEDFFTGAPWDITWETWGDTEFTWHEINQAGLVTFEDFD